MLRWTKLGVVSLAILMAAGCRVRIELPEGGYVESGSGRYDCRIGVGAESSGGAHLAGSKHVAHLVGSKVGATHDDDAVEASHCDILIEDASFNDTFTAVPYAGWEFRRWKKRTNGLFGGSKDIEVPVFTVGFDTIDAFMDIINSDAVYYLEPVFKKIKTTVGDANCSNFSGSYDRIQSIIFEGYNCTNSACHSSENAAGELDLSADVSYASLFRVPSAANVADEIQRVYPGEQKLSFLYNKLAAATLGTDLPDGGGLPMPLANIPLSTDHLEAMRLWIRNGAPETDDVDKVATLLGCGEGTAPQANKIDPPEPPAIGKGVQFNSGPWTVFPESENEVCFATYYDLEKTPGLLPAWAKETCEGGIYDNYDGSCMATNVRTLTQDPQSHHSIISVYVGEASPLDPSWGKWQCLNGPNEGKACDPTRIGEPVASGGADCGGDRYVCGTPAKKSVACTGWGPDDRRRSLIGMGGAQAPVSVSRLSEGVYSVLPTKGVITWNSHAFNLSDKETTVEQYNNFEFAPQSERTYRNRGIFDAKDIFVANVPPYEQRTYCSTYTLPKGARLTQLASHAHKRGILWQTWLPPQDRNCKVSNNCKPNKSKPDYVSRIYNDPLVIDYDPPLEYDRQNIDKRTLKFCVTYDNGDEFPDLLKQNSTSVGTTCIGNAYCVGGATPGQACGSDDSVCGDGGSCDACPVSGGVTTEDEMFLMLGNFYVVPPEERD
jgi:hypothetical protein